MMRVLSKSELLSFRQCPKKLWLQRHHPELETEPSGTKARLDAGIAVGAIARRLYDPEARGESLEVGVMGIEAALHRSRELLQSAQPIFEAGFSAMASIFPQARGAVGHLIVEASGRSPSPE